MKRVQIKISDSVSYLFKVRDSIEQTSVFSNGLYQNRGRFWSLDLARPVDWITAIPTTNALAVDELGARQTTYGCDWKDLLHNLLGRKVTIFNLPDPNGVDIVVMDGSSLTKDSLRLECYHIPHDEGMAI